VSYYEGYTSSLLKTKGQHKETADQPEEKRKRIEFLDEAAKEEPSFE
jgi:hypothetical protein